MTSFCDQLEGIRSLIYSDSKSNKSLGYSTLLQLQEQSDNLLSSIQILADNSHTLVSMIAIDISNDDEEIAAQALKCLGFMIYHPSIVAILSDDDANMILEALVKVIITTKIKSVCNLGMWCISMQQFDASFLAYRFHSVLRAVVHALNNPFGSLSTTFEAIQVVTRLAAQMSEKMRESSQIWAPPIYRRLISIDKKEKDMSERCLLKIRSVIIPPPAALSKGLVKDMKWKLLTGMKDILKQGMKVQALQAWGWFILLLGSHALKNRHLVNDMLKIPEKTFSDCSPQVQIASLVAWEGLVDALICPSLITSETNEGIDNGTEKLQISGEHGCQVQGNAFSKSIKLLMTPLIGIISSKNDVSVHLSCLNTWCYLLHKLDISIIHPLVIEMVLDPIFKAVFQMGPDIKTILLWSLCLDLLDNFMTAKCGIAEYKLSSQVSHNSICGKCLVNQHSIKWSPWSVGQLDFFIKMINIIFGRATVATITPQNRSSACDAALRIFRSLLKGVQTELKSSSINYANIMSCLNTILRFLREIFENKNIGGSGDNNLQHASFQFLLAVIDELEPSILGSPLYKVALDLRCIENLQSLEEFRYENFLGINFICYMDMVSPLDYLIILGICMVIQSTPSALTPELIPQGGLHKFFKLILLSYDPMENLGVAISFMYKCVSNRNLHIWIVIAEALQDCISSVNDLSLMRMEADSNGYLSICHLLSYPFLAWSSRQKLLVPGKVTGSSEESHVSADGNLELEHIIEVWKSLFCALCASKCSARNSISYNLCLMLNWFIDEKLGIIGCGSELDFSSKDLNFLSLSGNAVACMLEEVLTASLDRNKSTSAEPLVFDDIRNVLEFASRFLKLSWARIQADSLTNLPVTSRVFSVLTRLVSCLHFKQTVLSVTEIITCPLLQWLSREVTQDESKNNQLQHLWGEILNCLRTSQPPIVFDSVFLKLQAPLLEKTLDNPDSTISELTINFWNSTYGEQMKLDYPESLLDILDKLSRNKRINLHKKSLPFLIKCNSRPDLSAQRYRVTTTHNRSSKRVEVVQETLNHLEHKDNMGLSSKRKRLELTEHQKEVRRAQQGRTMDCNGHSPGIRTYTSLDFSQGNDDSQEIREIRNAESVLEIVEKSCIIACSKLEVNSL